MPATSGQARLLWVTIAAALFLTLATATRAGEIGIPGQAQHPAPLIELDGTISISPDGSELSYEWKQISGPQVALSDPRAPKPNFRTNRAGIYEFQLVVSANGLSSAPHIVRLEIEHENLPPVAKVPAEAAGQAEKLLEIDGRGSFDPEGQELLYRWRPLTPGLDIPLTALSASVLRFEPAKEGVYEIELVVSDGEKTSLPALCRLTVKPKPRPPVAQARIITLDVEPTGNPIERSGLPDASRPIAQVLAAPTPVNNRSGTVTVTSAAAPQVTEAKVKTSAIPRVQPGETPVTASSLWPFAADKASQEPITIPSIPPASAAAPPMPPLPSLPDDGSWVPSAPGAAPRRPPAATSFPPLPPMEPISVPPLSMEPAAEYNPWDEPWSEAMEENAALASAEADINRAALMDPSPMMPPAQPRYDVMAAPMTTLPFNRPRPAAIIRGPKVVEVGMPVILDARDSANNAAANLEYAWTLTRGDEITNIEKLWGGAGRRFTAIGPGVYEFELIVTDGGVQSAPTTYSVRFTNEPEPPIAIVTAPTMAQLGALVTLDATKSHDLGGERLIYRWRQTGGPTIRDYVIDERLGESSPAFYPPAPGTYSFELVVSNGKLNSSPVAIDVDVEAKLVAPQARNLAPLPRMNGNGAPVSVEPGRRGAFRVPQLTPMPNTQPLPSIEEFPPATIPDRGRPAATVLQNGKQR